MLRYLSSPFKWFFKLEAASGLVLLFSAIIALVISNSNLSENIKEDIVDEGDKDTESLKRSKEERSEKVKKKNDINYFNILIVIIISFIALILILDTFKVQLSLIIPNIEIVLDNLYLSINDVKLFILDLIK